MKKAITLCDLTGIIVEKVAGLDFVSVENSLNQHLHRKSGKPIGFASLESNQRVTI